MERLDQLSIETLATISRIPAKVLPVDQCPTDTPDENRKAGSKPGAKSWWMACLRRIERSYLANKQRRISRKACRQLLELDDSLLEDMGIDRGDIIHTVRQQAPLISSSVELENLVRGSRTPHSTRERMASILRGVDVSR